MGVVVAGSGVVVGCVAAVVAGWPKKLLIDRLVRDGSAYLLLHTAQQAHLVQVRLLARHRHFFAVAQVECLVHWQQGPNARHCRLFLLLFEICVAAAVALVRDLRPTAASK